MRNCSPQFFAWHFFEAVCHRNHRNSAFQAVNWGSWEVDFGGHWILCILEARSLRRHRRGAWAGPAGRLRCRERRPFWMEIQILFLCWQFFETGDFGSAFFLLLLRGRVLFCLMGDRNSESICLVIENWLFKKIEQLSNILIGIQFWSFLSNKFLKSFNFSLKKKVQMTKNLNIFQNILPQICT